MKWFQRKSEQLLPERTREDELVETAAQMVCNWVLKQLATCGFSKKEIKLDRRAGSIEVLAYIAGYARGVHEHLELASGVKLNDANVMVVSMQAVFFQDNFVRVHDAYLEVQSAFLTRNASVRAALDFGIEDWNQMTQPKPYQIPGLIKIFGMGGKK